MRAWIVSWRLELVCAVIACVVCLVVATAVHASPAPEGTASDCSWAEHGTTIEIGEHSYTCHCAEFTGPNGKVVRCVWIDEGALSGAATKKRIPAKKKPAHKPKLRVYPKAVVA